MALDLSHQLLSPRLRSGDMQCNSAHALTTALACDRAGGCSGRSAHAPRRAQVRGPGSLARAAAALAACRSPLCSFLAPTKL